MMKIGWTSIGMIMNRQALGGVGAVILFLGVFTPVVSGPLLGSLPYFQTGIQLGTFNNGTILLPLALMVEVGRPIGLTQAEREDWGVAKAAMYGLPVTYALLFGRSLALLVRDKKRQRIGQDEPTRRGATVGVALTLFSVYFMATR